MIYYRFGTREIQILIVFDIAFNKKTTVDRLHVLLSMNAIFLFNSKCKWQATPNLIRNNNREYTFSNQCFFQYSISNNFCFNYLKLLINIDELSSLTARSSISFLRRAFGQQVNYQFE